MNQPDNQQRACVTCGRPFTIPAKNPHKRFCSSRCRVADWHARNDHTHDIPNDAPAANAAPNPTQTANGIQRCPHCHHELVVIAVLVPPTAAHVRLPEVTHMPT